MSEQHNTARESGVQYITSAGDINVYPPRGGGGRFAKRRVLLAAGAIVAAAATAVTLALLPSPPPAARTRAAGSSAHSPAGVPAHSAPSSASAAPKASAGSGASSAPERPESRDAPSAAPAPGRPDADSDLKEGSAPDSRADGTPHAAVRSKSWSTSYVDGTVCAVGDEWTQVPGMTGINFQACTYAVSSSGNAQFGVKVRNTSKRQVAVAVWVEYWMTKQQYNCSTLFPQDHVVIDPGTTWYSQMRNCIRSLKGEKHRVQAYAGVSEEGGSPRYSRLAPSRGVDIFENGTAVPVIYPN
ncbi:hypothetical protein V7793_07325 [Streptomyces sp. KLMMK]|uniref:hypothetical protein n=1 Tax=Streptomyces sp. KLMMK TaxID=3109353 RepID=UPI00300097F3